jgi:hypothetical protein
METVSTGTVAVLFAFGVLAGGAATLWMDLVMGRLPEGKMPPLVAAGVLTGRPPGGAPRGLALAVHYLAGTLTGGLVVWFGFASRSLLEEPVASLVAGAVLYLLMVGVFLVVLARSRVQPERAGAIGRDWAVSAAAYLVVLVGIVRAGTELVL